MRLKKISSAILLVTLVAGVAVGQSNGTDPGQWIKRGNARYLKAEYLRAIEEYERVLPQAGEMYSQALYNIGVCYYELWRTEEAIAMYKRATSARTGAYSIALYALGVAFEDLKRPQEAKEAYQRALSAESGSRSSAAHFRLGLLLANENDLEGAAFHFEKAVTRESSPASHNNLGVVLALRGQLHEAEKEFELALKQAGGAFADATNNLKLCRSLLKTSAKAPAGSLKLVAKRQEPGKISRIE